MQQPSLFELYKSVVLTVQFIWDSIGLSRDGIYLSWVHEQRVEMKCWRGRGVKQGSTGCLVATNVDLLHDQ